MAQVHERKQSRWLVIRRSSSKPKRDEVVSRIPGVEWEVALDVCLRKYGPRARLTTWQHASKAQQRAAELLPVTYIAEATGAGGYAQMGNEPVVRSAAGGAR
jgi:hypothetical protein